MQGHEHHCGGVIGVQGVHVGHQRHLLEKLLDVAHLIGCAHQFRQVLDTAVGLHGVLGFEFGQIARTVQQGGQGGTGAVGQQVGASLHQRQEGGDPLEGLAGHPGLGGAAHGIGERHLVGVGPGVQPSHRRLPHPAARHVEHPLDADLVSRVHHGAQVGECVAHLPAVVEPGAADDLVGHPHAVELVFHHPALGVGAVEHRQVTPSVGAAVVQVQQLVTQPLGLVELVLGPVAHDGLTGALVGPQLLGPPRGVLADHGVGGVEDGLGGAVVLGQHHHGGVGVGLLESQDVAHVGTPEPVDRLVAVAHHAHVAVLVGQGHDQLVLHGVGVLVLVDQYVREATLITLQHVGELTKQCHHVAQQVVEVHGAGGAQAILVGAVHLGQLALVGHGGGALEVRRAHPVVFARRDHRRHRLGRELLGVEAHVADHVPAQALGIGLVVDGERRRVAEVVGLAPQDAHARRVEGGHPHAVGHRTHQLGHPVAHLVGGLVGERDGQNGVGRHTLVADQVGNAVGEHPGLARPGPSHHQQGSVGVQHRLALGRVHPLQQGGDGVALGHAAVHVGRPVVTVERVGVGTVGGVIHEMTTVPVPGQTSSRRVRRNSRTWSRAWRVG